LGFLLSMGVGAVVFMGVSSGCGCFSCHAWHVPTCRTPPGEGGAARRKGRGISHAWRGGRRLERKARAQRRSAQAQRGRLGKPLAPRQGSALSEVWFPYSCALAHRNCQGRVAAGTGRRGGSGRRAAAEAWEETSARRNSFGLRV
jgi:hypothetical protein